jgi:hypothetical protein
MADLHGFNANEVDPTTDLEPIPAGKYLAMITDSEMKPTKSGDGRYLQLTFQILEGPYKNRFVWARLILHNANETAVKIARAELSAICRAVGVLTPRDSCELHNLPLVITVKLKKRGHRRAAERGPRLRQEGGGFGPAAAGSLQRSTLASLIPNAWPVTSSERASPGRHLTWSADGFGSAYATRAQVRLLLHEEAS